MAGQPGTEARDRRQGGKGLEPGEFLLSVSTTRLISESPKLTPRRPVLGVADGVEDGGGGPPQVGTAAADSSSSGVMLWAMASSSATSTKISGSSGRRG
jgi:hypothetical protein